MRREFRIDINDILKLDGFETILKKLDTPIIDSKSQIEELTIFDPTLVSSLIKAQEQVSELNGLLNADNYWLQGIIVSIPNSKPAVDDIHNFLNKMVKSYNTLSIRGSNVNLRLEELKFDSCSYPNVHKLLETYLSDNEHLIKEYDGQLLTTLRSKSDYDDKLKEIPSYENVTIEFDGDNKLLAEIIICMYICQKIACNIPIAFPIKFSSESTLLINAIAVIEYQ